MAGRHKLGKAGKGKEEVGSLAQSGLGGHPCAGTSRGQLERLSDKADWEHYTVGSTQGSWMSSQKVLPSDSAPSPNLQSVNQFSRSVVSDFLRLRECGSREWCLTAASAQLSPSLRT